MTQLNSKYLTIPFFFLLTGCISTNTVKTPDMLRLAMCSADKETADFEQEIYAEHGFKRFTKNTYKPVIERTLLGHQVRVINLEPTGNIIYVSGTPQELGNHFKSYVLPTLECSDKTCQGKINENQTIHIYKAKTKKTKDTTVIECTKKSQDSEQAE